MQTAVLALVAPHATSVARSGFPCVRAGGTVSHATVFAQVAASVCILPTPKERPVERNLLQVWLVLITVPMASVRQAEHVDTRPLARKRNDLSTVPSCEEDNVTRSANASRKFRKSEVVWVIIPADGGSPPPRTATRGSRGALGRHPPSCRARTRSGAHPLWPMPPRGRMPHLHTTSVLRVIRVKEAARTPGLPSRAMSCAIAPLYLSRPLTY